ncbi:MAG: NAD(P)H-dependent glycerol-3-phosphate dehydrogenase [Hyphomicrobiales bacterium]
MLISVIGGGAWGTALTAHLARAGKTPKLWARSQELVADINNNRQNARYLAGITLPTGIFATTNLADLKGTEIALVVIPTQSLRSVLEEAKPFLSNDTKILLCAKGIEKTTGKRTSDIAAEVLPNNPIAVLSGPSFAHDVARGLPTAVTLAAPTLAMATSLSETISSQGLRTYASNDVIGAELGGALKNVIALAVGMARARKLGASAEAALTTRGFAELSRIARHFGAQPETLMGLSCLGDLMLTCSSPQSRNFAYGMAVGNGDDLTQMKLAEGVHTTSIAAKICKEASISAPIIDAIDAVLSDALPIDEAMRKLMQRPLKAEIG